jgi:hypothetical protein
MTAIEKQSEGIGEGGMGEEMIGKKRDFAGPEMDRFVRFF